MNSDEAVTSRYDTSPLVKYNVLRCKSCRRGLVVMGVDAPDKYCKKCGSRGPWTNVLGPISLIETLSILRRTRGQLMLVNPGGRLESLLRRVL